jgi:hypothetical protein
MDLLSDNLAVLVETGTYMGSNLCVGQGIFVSLIESDTETIGHELAAEQICLPAKVWRCRFDDQIVMRP